MPTPTDRPASCLKCGKETPQTRRGLCVSCYHKFRRGQQLLDTEQERLEYETDAIDKGWLKVAYEKNDFAELAQQIIDRRPKTDNIDYRLAKEPLGLAKEELTNQEEPGDPPPTPPRKE